MATLPISNCIKYWEGVLFHDRFLLSPNVQVIVESTLKYLGELKGIKEKDVKSKG